MRAGGEAARPHLPTSIPPPHAALRRGEGARVGFDTPTYQLKQGMPHYNPPLSQIQAKEGLEME